MTHAHRWTGLSISMLTLPAFDGTYEALRVWRCRTCGAEGTAVGTLDATPCTLTPAQWDKAVSKQRTNTDAAAQQMARHWRQVERGQRRLKH